MKIRVLALFLSVLMIVLCFPLAANAASISLNRPLDSTYSITAREYYSNGSYHGAIDYGCPKGTPVYAAERGTVTLHDGGFGDGYYGSSDGSGWGNYIDIAHYNGYSTRYAHMSTGRFVVNTGDVVERGQLIGYSGNSGNSTGPHLHFGLYLNGQKVYPESYIDTAVEVTSYADLGDDFYGIILNTNAWKPISYNTENNKITLESEKNAAYQKWRFTRQEDGAYLIRSCYNGNILEMSGGKREVCTQLTAPHDNWWEGAYQQWYLIPYGNGYIFENKHYTSEGWVMDLYAGDDSDGNVIQINNRNNSNAQIWSVYKSSDVQLHKPENVRITTNESAVTFTWDRVYGATDYDVKIWKDAACEAEHVYTGWSITSNTFTKDLPAGTYYVYVVANDAFDYFGSDNYKFTVTLSKYNVTYNANGGTGAPSSQIKTYGQDLTLSSTVPTRTGYTFLGWAKSSTATSATYQPGGKYTDNAAATLYAIWAPDTNTAYKVNHYQMNVSGSGYTLKETENKTGTTASSVTIANLKKTYTGFTYVGGKGATAATATKPSTLDTTTTILADGTRVINIYYSRNKYALTLSKGTGIASVSGAGTYYYGQSVSIDATVSTGYTWSKWSDGNTTKARTYTMPAAATTLTANATANTNTAYKVNHYQMNVSGSGYTLKETENKTGTTASSVTIANLKKTYTGFTYEGGKGATAAAATKPSTLDTTTTVLADGTRVINIYYSRNKYALTLSKGTGIASVSGAGTYYYGQSVSIDATVSTGYTWSKWSDGNTTKARTYTMPAAATTLTANATANTNTAYKVNHYQMNVSGSGYTLKETENKTGTTAASVTIANLKKTYTGFTYEGGKGATAAAATKPSTLDTTTTVLADGTRVINIYYSRNKYALTLSKGTGIASVSGAGTYYYGQSVSIDATVSTGYTWSKWSDGNTTKARTYTMPAAAATLTASADINTYTVTFNANGGTNAPASQTKTYDVNLTLTSTVPTRDKYIFTGWATTANATKADYAPGSTYTANSAVTLYAVWQLAHTHNYTSEITTKATCTTDGLKTFRCACGDTYTEVIPATGHKTTIWITEEDATCSTDGLKVEYCLDCSELVKTEIIPATGHIHTEWKTVTKATCTEDGLQNEYCLDCKALLNTEVIPALGHRFVLKETASAHPHDETYKCIRCGETKTEAGKYSETCPECNFTVTTVNASSVKISGYNGSLAKLTVPAKLGGKKVTATATGALKANTTLTEVKFESGVTEIGSLTFMNCSNLKKAVIPESVTTIGTYAFYGCAEDFTIYCYGGSAAQEYAEDNGIAYVIMDIGETAKSEIDYGFKYIFTNENAVTDLSELVYTPAKTIAIAAASFTEGGAEYLGTGSVVTVFANNTLTGEYTVIVDGDLDGDSVCDVLDIANAERIANGHENATAEQVLAATGESGDSLSVADYAALVNKTLAK